MTAEIVVIGAIRILGSLPVLRWPLAGAIVAILVDLSDLLLMNVLDLGGIGDYQRFDKYVDQVYLAAFLVVALRWRGLPRSISIGLYAWRLFGFVLYELTGERSLLLFFPNLFEFWFLVVAATRGRWPDEAWTPRASAAALAILLGLKELQEWALHEAKLFDSITALGALEEAWRWLTGPFR